MKTDDYRNKNILPLVLSMSMPMVLSMLVNALYNIVDSFYVAKISEEAMSALSLIYPLQNVSGAVAVGFGVGANAVTAFFLGQRNQKEADGAASLSLVLSFVHTVILMIVLLLLCHPFLNSFTNDSVILQYGDTYGRIVFGGLVFHQVSLVYEKLFQAVGMVKVSMFSMILGCVTNIVLDPVMIFGYGFMPSMGIEGAAIATVIGQMVTLLSYLVFWHFKDTGLRLSLTSAIHNKGLYKRLYQIGIPAILSQALPSAMITCLNAILSSLSDAGVLILGIYYKLQTFIYLSANGVVQGIRPLIAYNYGAGLLKRVRDVVKSALVLCVIVMGVGMLLCLIMPEQLIMLFTNNETTIAAGASALRIICFGFVVSAVSLVISGTMEALGSGSLSFFISLLRYVVIIVPCAWILSRIIGINGVWFSFIVTEFIAAGIALLLYKQKMKKITSENKVF